MRTTRLTLCALAVGFAAACADDGSDTSELKLAASQAYKNETPAMRPAKDLCLEHRWYDDGECDSWCPKGDPKDCTATDSGGGSDGQPGDGVVCTLIWSPADGKCDLTNPCAKVQDEDCQDAGDDPVACAEIFRLADGKCDLTDPCAKVQDEDCQNDDEPVGCIAIAYGTNGKCEAAKGCEASDPVDCAEPVACIALAYETNGKCEPPKGCEQNDPVDCKVDGGVACTKILYPTNGKCEAASGCEDSDPVDCAPDGVVCIEIAYAANGKCEAAPGCEYTDPKDCKKDLICPAIYIPKDKVCPPNQPCDPDCADQPVSSP